MGVCVYVLLVYLDFPHSNHCIAKRQPRFESRENLSDYNCLSEWWDFFLSFISVVNNKKWPMFIGYSSN